MQLLQVHMLDRASLLENPTYQEYVVDAMIREMALFAIGQGRDFLTHTLKYGQEPSLEAEGYDRIGMSAWCE